MKASEVHTEEEVWNALIADDKRKVVNRHINVSNPMATFADLKRWMNDDNLLQLHKVLGDYLDELTKS